MKKHFLFVLNIILFNVLNAQWSVGINAGYTNNELYTNISNYDYNYYKRRGGFMLSAPIQYAVNDWFSLQGEPGYIQKSFSLCQNLTAHPSTQLTSSYNYLQLPLMTQFSFGVKKWRGYVDLGAYGAWWLSGTIKGAELDGFNYTYPIFSNLTQQVDAEYEFDSRRDRRIQCGWLAGGGIRYILHEKMNLFAEGRYYSDLTDQQKKYMNNQMPRYNLTTSITMGFMYHLAPEKNKNQLQ